MKFIKKTSLGNILLSCTKNPIVMFFFLFSENTVSEQKTKSNGNLLILVLKSILCHNAQIGDKSIDI